jgi:hypothetical protein
MSHLDEQAKIEQVEASIKQYFEVVEVREFEEMLEYGTYEEGHLCRFIMEHVLSDEDVAILAKNRLSVADIFNGRYTDDQADDVRDIAVGINYDMGVRMFHLEMF